MTGQLSLMLIRGKGRYAVCVWPLNAEQPRYLRQGKLEEDKARATLYTAPSLAWKALEKYQATVRDQHGFHLQAYVLDIQNPERAVY